jgi:hypothetical protein
MARAVLKTETTTGPVAAAATRTSIGWPNFEGPKFGASDVYRDLFEQTCITYARGASEYSTKLIDVTSTNANNFFKFADELASARSWPEVVAAYTSQAGKQFEAFSVQAQELSELAQKVTADTLVPLTSTFPAILKTAAASS